MPDISMCADDKCPSRAECRRHEASGTRPSEFRQSYAFFKRSPKDRRCEYYWHWPREKGEPTRL